MGLMCLSPTRSAAARMKAPLTSCSPDVTVCMQPSTCGSSVRWGRLTLRLRRFVMDTAADFAQGMSSVVDVLRILGVTRTRDSSGQAPRSHLILFLPLLSVLSLPLLAVLQLILPRLPNLTTMWFVRGVVAARVESMRLLLMCL